MSLGPSPKPSDRAQACDATVEALNVGPWLLSADGRTVLARRVGGGLLGPVHEKAVSIRKGVCMGLYPKTHRSFRRSVVSAQPVRPVSPFGAGRRKPRGAAGAQR